MLLKAVNIIVVEGVTFSPFGGCSGPAVRANKSRQPSHLGLVGGHFLFDRRVFFGLDRLCGRSFLFHLLFVHMFQCYCSGENEVVKSGTIYGKIMRKPRYARLVN